MAHLASDYPGLVPDYELLYEGKYLPAAEAYAREAVVHGLRDRYAIADHRSRPIEAPPGPEQLALAL
jgi:hypothetical protein